MPYHTEINGSLNMEEVQWHSRKAQNQAAYQHLGFAGLQVKTKNISHLLFSFYNMTACLRDVKEYYILNGNVSYN